MQNKIKVGVVCVAIVAGFSVYKLAGFLHSAALNGPNLKLEASIATASNDPDGDGLSNAEEAFWNTDPLDDDTDNDGFKDGEETISGHNPLVPGPNDEIGQENLTDHLSKLVVSGLYAGALDPASGSYDQTLHKITDSIADSAKYGLNKSIDPSILNVIVSNNKTDTAYLNQLVPIAQEFGRVLDTQYQNIEATMNTIGHEGFGSPLVQDFFMAQANSSGQILNQATPMTIPRNFKENHVEFLNFVYRFKIASDAVAKGEQDPIKAAISLNRLSGAYTDFVRILTTYASIAEQHQIDLSGLVKPAIR